MRFAWMLPVVFVLLSAAPNPGVVFEIEVTYQDRGTSTTMVSVEEPHLKMPVNASGRRSPSGEMIYRGDRREVIVVDHDDKSYTVLDEEVAARIGGQVAGVRKQMEQAMANLTDEQREAIERARAQGVEMPGMPAAEGRDTALRFEKIGQESRAGYPCVKYVAFRGEQKIRELWVTDWDNIEGGAEAQRVFFDLAGFFADVGEAFGEGGMMGKEGGFGEGTFEMMKEIDGFPVVTREFGDDGTLDSESVLRSAHRRTLDPADFEPPAGYKRRSMFGGN